MIANSSFKKKFLVFLKKQHLESKVLELLAVVSLVNQEQTNYFLLQEIENKITAPSLLSDICLEEIFQIKIEKQNRPWIENHSDYAPNNFLVEVFNHRQNGIVRNNFNFLKKICNVELNLEKQFYFEYKQVVAKEKHLYYGNIDYFCNTGYAGTPNIKLLQDDVQISAFLRLISFCVDLYNLPIDWALFLSRDFFPIDFGLLELKPTVRPVFLEELINYDFKQWNFQKHDFIPVYLSCPLKIDSNSLFDKEIITLDIYPVHLSYTPKSLEKYFEFFRRGKKKKKMRGISWHANIKRLNVPKDIPEHFIGLFHKCCNYIQKMYTIHRDLFIPNERDLRIEINNDKLIFKIDNQIIGYMQYWYDNYGVFGYKGTAICAGVITCLHKDYLDKINKDNDVKILINYKILKANYGKHFEQNKNLYYLIKI